MDAIEYEMPVTMPVTEFGEVAFGLGRNGSYAAANKGTFEIFEVQGKKHVSPRKELRKLAGDDPAVLEAVMKDFALKLKRHRTSESKRRKAAA
jgi:hypothetical protein